MIEQTLSIAFTIDNGYVNQLKVVIYSLLKHKKPSTVYHIYLLAYRFLPENIIAIEKVLKDHDISGLCQFHYLALSDEDYADIPNLNEANVGIRAGWNKDVVLRLYLDKYLPATVERVLYLDADILVQDDLSELLKVDLSQKALAGVLDPIHFDIYGVLALHNYRLAKLEGLSDEEYRQHFTLHGYINSGVLLLNMAYWRKERLGRQMIELLNRIYQEGEHFIPFPNQNFPISKSNIRWQEKFFPDQDVINYVLLRRGLSEITYLPINYNISTAMFSQNTKLKPDEWDVLLWLNQLHCNRLVKIDDLKTAGEQPKIWHFIGTKKPWISQEHPFSALYGQYAQAVDWHILYMPEEKPNQIKRVIKMLTPYGVVRLIQKLRSH